MRLSNPRVFSTRLALVVAAAVSVSGFICFSLEFGNGSLFRGVSGAASYLTVFGISFIVLAGLAVTIALFAGRLIGITLTATVAFCLLLALTITTYVASKPISRFRRLVWQEAPASLAIRQHHVLRSFSDGTTYTFIVECDVQTLTNLCRAANLAKKPKDPFNADLLSPFFPDVAFSSEIEFFRGGSLELAHHPSTKTAWVVYTPSH